MGGDLAKRNQCLYYRYHQDHGHTIKDCRTLHDHLEQLVKVKRLKQFMHQPFGQGSQVGSGYQREAISKPPLGTINVILAIPSQTKSHTSEVMSIAARQDTEEQVPEFKWVKIEVWPTLGFSDKDKIETYQPHDNALVVTLLIGGYDVKRVLVNQGSEVEIMYPDLYKRLNLKLEDLLRYDYPLVGFDRKMVIPKGMIKLPVQTRAEIVEMDFIVVDAFSLYTAILAKSWLHAMGAIILLCT